MKLQARSDVKLADLPERLRRPAPALSSPDAVVLSEPSAARRASGIGHAVAHFAGKFFLPSNYPNSVSKDYGVTRKWQLTRDLTGTVACGYAMGMAVSAATMPGLAAMGLTLFSYGLIKDRLNQVAGFLTSTCITTAVRNPRAWMLGGDILDSAGVAALSCSALVPHAFVPMAIGIGVMQVFATTMHGAAGADIARRQAITDNLGELNAKNANQSLVINNVGMAVGGALSAVLGSTLGGATLPVIGAVAAGAGIFATARLLSNLDMHPVNEEAVRKLVDGLDKDGKVVSPERDKVWAAIPKMWHPDKIKLGRHVDLLKRDPARFEELKGMYADKNYILESVGGKPYVVCKAESTAEDRFQAMIQAVRVENLRSGSKYSGIVADKGQDAADFWLVSQSLAQTPKDVKPLLGEVKAAGWSTDLLRFLDTGERARAAELA